MFGIWPIRFVSWSEVEIFEVYRTVETLIGRHLYIDNAGQWIQRPMLCAGFSDRYPQRPCSDVQCAFRDRQ